MTSMHVNHARDVPEYEINPKELDFTNSKEITKGTFCIALWRGTEVAVKKLGDELSEMSLLCSRRFVIQV
ncbi:hypothetical protein RYX36_001307 [Vicia faba]